MRPQQPVAPSRRPCGDDARTCQRRPRRADGGDVERYPGEPCSRSGPAFGRDAVGAIGRCAGHTPAMARVIAGSRTHEVTRSHEARSREANLSLTGASYFALRASYVRGSSSIRDPAPQRFSQSPAAVTLAVRTASLVLVVSAFFVLRVALAKECTISCLLSAMP